MRVLLFLSLSFSLYFNLLAISIYHEKYNVNIFEYYNHFRVFWYKFFSSNDMKREKTHAQNYYSRNNVTYDMDFIRQAEMVGRFGELKKSGRKWSNIPRKIAYKFKNVSSFRETQNLHSQKIIQRRYYFVFEFSHSIFEFIFIAQIGCRSNQISFSSSLNIQKHFRSSLVCGLIIFLGVCYVSMLFFSFNDSLHMIFVSHSFHWMLEHNNNNFSLFW